MSHRHNHDSRRKNTALTLAPGPYKSAKPIPGLGYGHMERDVSRWELNHQDVRRKISLVPGSVPIPSIRKSPTLRKSAIKSNTPSPAYGRALPREMNPSPDFPQDRSSFHNDHHHGGKPAASASPRYQKVERRAAGSWNEDADETPAPSYYKNSMPSSRHSNRSGGSTPRQQPLRTTGRGNTPLPDVPQLSGLSSLFLRPDTYNDPHRTAGHGRGSQRRA